MGPRRDQPAPPLYTSAERQRRDASPWTLVQGVLLGAADTDITANYDGPKIDPRDVPRRSLDGLETGSIEVIVDDWTAMVKASLAGDPAPFYAQMTELLGAS